MAEPEGKHVFVSYVHEDTEQVDALCEVLGAAGIPYWRDRTSLAPGDAWKAKIRAAIRDGSLVFLACFSESSRARTKSHMNEELTIAVEEFRKMSPGRTWLIPVRFDTGDLPNWDLGAGRALDDLNYVDLFGPGYAANAVALVTTIHRVMGERQLSPETALAAVEQAANADRRDLLKRLTKQMLLEPTRQIELDDLISQEVQRVLAVLNDPAQVSGPLDGTNDERVVEVARRANELWKLTEPFCGSLQVAARWGTPDRLAPWVNGLQAFLTATQRTDTGIDALIAQRHLPGMIGVVTATLASVASNKWSNLRTLVVEPTVRIRGTNTSLALFEATDPHKPFPPTKFVALALARANAHDGDLAEALADFTVRKGGQLHTPASDWLHEILRPIFAEQIPDQDNYDLLFDRMEAVLGTLAQDQANIDQRRWTNAYWLGRATWHVGFGHAPVTEMADELKKQGANWGPLKADLFGGDIERARSAIETHIEQFNAAKRW